MFRFVAIALLGLALAACEQRVAPNLEANFSVGDECWVVPRQRPANCIVTPTCTYIDAIIELDQTRRGAFTLSAHTPGPDFYTDQRRAEFGPAQVASVDQATAQLPRILEALGTPAAAREDACIAMRPSQTLATEDVIAFHDGLIAHGAQHVQLYAELAETP